jgi:inosose dehydratase
MAVHVGTAPDSWGVWFPEHPQQTPWQRFLDEVAEAGYDAVELGPFGYLPTQPDRLAAELGARGLTLSGGMLFRDFTAPDAWRDIEPEFRKVSELLLTLGARYLVLINTPYTNLFTGEPIASPELRPDEWAAMVTALSEASEAARGVGLTPVYHPHAETVVEYEAQVERLLGDTDPGLLGLCLDIGHLAYRGADVPAFIRRHPDRIAYLHLKNVDAGIRERVERERIPFAEAVGMLMFSDLADGVVDFREVREALAEIGYDGWGIVEQDMFPTSFDRPLPIARRNREHLREIGIG